MDKKGYGLFRGLVVRYNYKKQMGIRHLPELKL